MNKKYINMQTIKFLKNNYIQLNKTIYRPYTICQLADTRFGEVDKDGFSMITDWFNYKGFTYVAV